MTVRVLIDDERSFADNRECMIARDVDSGVKLLSEIGHIDELWLDFVLAGSESVDEILSQLLRHNVKLSVSKVYIHSSAISAFGLLSKLLVELGVDKDSIDSQSAYLHF